MDNLPSLEELDKGAAEFVWIQIDYSKNRVFPLEEGLQYIKFLSMARFVYSPSATPKISREEMRFEFGFLTRDEIAEDIVGQELLLRGSEDD